MQPTVPSGTREIIWSKGCNLFDILGSRLPGTIQDALYHHVVVRQFAGCVWRWCQELGSNQKLSQSHPEQDLFV